MGVERGYHQAVGVVLTKKEVKQLRKLFQVEAEMPFDAEELTTGLQAHLGNDLLHVESCANNWLNQVHAYYVYAPRLSPIFWGDDTDVGIHAYGTKVAALTEAERDAFAATVNLLGRQATDNDVREFLAVSFI